MFAVCVTFELVPGGTGRFMPLIREQAATTLDREPRCKRFEIWTDAARPDTVFLFEEYDDADAFEQHLHCSHFIAFDAAVRDMVASRRVITWDQKG